LVQYIPSKCDDYVYVDPYVLKELHEGLKGLKGKDQRGRPWEQIYIDTIQIVLNIITEENICYCMSKYEAFCKRRCGKILEKLEERGITCDRKDCLDSLDPGERLEGIIEVSKELCKNEERALESICHALRVLEYMDYHFYERYRRDYWKQWLCYEVDCELTQYLLRDSRCFEYLFLFAERKALCEHCQSVSCIAAALCKQKSILLSVHSSEHILKQIGIDNIGGTGYHCNVHGGVIFCNDLNSEKKHRLH